IGSDSFFFSRSGQLGALALRHAIPAIAPYREFAAAGGLMSYGTNNANQFRQVGIYASRILKGEKPADLPVEQAVKLNLLINLKTARALSLAVPWIMQMTADEVMEGEGARSSRSSGARRPRGRSRRARSNRSGCGASRLS